jgi:hypothetical protein
MSTGCSRPGAPGSSPARPGARRLAAHVFECLGRQHHECNDQHHESSWQKHDKRDCDDHQLDEPCREAEERNRKSPRNSHLSTPFMRTQILVIRTRSTLSLAGAWK